MFKLSVKVEHDFRHVCGGFHWVGGNALVVSNRNGTNHGRWLVHTAYCMFDMAHGDTCGKYREKTNAINDMRYPVRQRDQPERQEFFHSQRLPVFLSHIQ